MSKYDHKVIEHKWQRQWEKDKLYKTPDKKAGAENFYLLTEFPYPSGNLHVGHWYAFSVPDILARMLRMQGKNVLYPIGFDAFGLPAENAAIKNKINPRTWTEKNITYMKKQIRSMGASFDWSREVVTCDPVYYKWTQWQFLQFFKKGLAYQKETPVNWCPSCKTVLANEQVIEGRCERCETEVVQKQMLQWNLRITDYADRLIDDLKKLDWPEPIKEAQRAWIGRSEGAEIDFPLVEKDVKRIVLLHGREASSKSLFLPWLKKKLEERGYTVEVPDMPNPNNPNDDEQTEYVRKHCKLDAHTAVVGHSFGGIVALRLLERGVKLGRVTLVGTPYSGNWLDSKKRPTVRVALKKGFDFKTIRKSCDGFVALYDTGDKIVPMSDGEAYAKKLSCPLIKGKGTEWHFLGKQEPDVLRAAAPSITVFTTRADTLFGGTYLVLAPEHPWITLALQHRGLLKNEVEIGRYIAISRKKTERERQESKDKTGVELKGMKAINPATGKEIPLWVADFVIGSYGTGAVFADAHDERDWEFAMKYNIPLKETLEPLVIRSSGLDAVRKEGSFFDRPAILAFVQHWSEEKYLAVRYKPTDTRGCVSGGVNAGEDIIEAAKREVCEETGYVNTEFVRKLGTPIHGKYYSDVRKMNIFAHFTPLLFKLTDGSRQEISQKEREDHDVMWLSKKEMGDYINREDMHIAWSRVGGDVCYAWKGILFDSGEFNGLTSDEAIPKIGAKYGRLVKQYHLRDWIVSRQRYWGVPIPIVHCPKCGLQPVGDKNLPIKLPEIKDYLPDGRGKSPLAKAKKWVSVKCPKCKGKAERETDTLDTFVDSSWYFLRYTDPKNSKQFAANSKQKNWMPINLYSGGAEHTTMHVLYSRFWHKALFDLGLVRDKEPYTRRMNRSLILGADGQKMSKSRGNVIDPDEVVERLGADTVRMYLAFIGPYNEVSSYPWNPDGVVGIRRFLERVWRLGQRPSNIMDVRHPYIESLLQKTIKKVGEDIVAQKFNTAISALMIFLNSVEKEALRQAQGKQAIGKGQWEIFLKLLAPFAPHIAEELWDGLGHEISIHKEKWPAYDPAKLKDEIVTIAVQINGKTRGEAEVPADADKSILEKAAREAVTSRLEGKQIVRTIVVPGRLVNFVIVE
ncbi:hypothetical protein A3A39_04195 [Candidatus Kaiserbacteria bacterium RIFCSPLOWO2_01_FULL_54_13]|uniref:Leucine--tRNA ligase n=1 Tax=Candidatus Kaiserbacteria bacterium RIFCSPLOWO2_01_FULL_54_13 TaxID=1798512 RepID=A0A1F6F3M9_9BACT|nr:MAG: hypothetical protein A3A39_04195 [Candidatus Kaiserbacteria bacterium RIFCSPLOWO2_01_FULL_54_13]